MIMGSLPMTAFLTSVTMSFICFAQVVLFIIDSPVKYKIQNHYTIL